MHNLKFQLADLISLNNDEGVEPRLTLLWIDDEGITGEVSLIIAKQREFFAQNFFYNNLSAFDTVEQLVKDIDSMQLESPPIDHQLNLFISNASDLFVNKDSRRLHELRNYAVERNFHIILLLRSPIHRHNYSMFTTPRDFDTWLSNENTRHALHCDIVAYVVCAGPKIMAYRTKARGAGDDAECVVMQGRTAPEYVKAKTVDWKD